MQIIKFKDVVVTSLSKGIVFIAEECTAQIEDDLAIVICSKNEKFEIALNDCFSFESEGTIIRGAAIEKIGDRALIKLKEHLSENKNNT